MTYSPPTPPVQPLQRLRVTDGLLINAERWRLAYDYHRQRQSLYYQSLHQPGIVCGLGIHPIAPPKKIDQAYQDQRWLQIQPGMAIDDLGNCIVVPEPIDFRIASRVQQPATVYLVLQYVDPEQLQQAEDNPVLTEMFRIEEKTHPPGPGEVEICRLVLDTQAQIQLPTDPFFPQINQVDLRYRLQPRSRPQAVLNVAQVSLSAPSPQLQQSADNFQAFLRSIEVLYPKLLAVSAPDPIELADQNLAVDLRDYDVLYLQTQTAHSLSDVQVRSLQSFLMQGGYLWVEVSVQGTQLAELIAVKAQLETALAQIDGSQALGASAETQNRQSLRQDITQELTAVQQALTIKLDETGLAFRALAEKMGQPLQALPTDHPLGCHPFQFGALPSVNQQPVELFLSKHLLMVVGDLSVVWGGGSKPGFARDQIRTAQEFGINILHYAWQQQHYHQLLATPTTASTS